MQHEHIESSDISAHDKIEKPGPDGRHLMAMFDPAVDMLDEAAHVDSDPVAAAAVKIATSNDINNDKNAQFIVQEPKRLAVGKMEPEVKNAEGGDHSNHALIGVALTLGFVLMFLVDQLGTVSCCKVCTRPVFSLISCRCCRKDMMLRMLLFSCSFGLLFCFYR